MLTNTLFGTTPALIHAQGPHDPKPMFERLCSDFFRTPRRELGPTHGLTVLTWNNGNAGMGLLEKSLTHLGVPCLVTGQGIKPWVNSRHKPSLTAEALTNMNSEYLLGADSRDAIFVDDPAHILREFQTAWNCDLVFSADQLNWPNLRRFRDFENTLPGAEGSQFRFLNSGAFIGKVDFCREFFARAAQTAPAPEAPEVDQGIFKELFRQYYPKVQLDYRCRMFQNLGFVSKPILEWSSTAIRLDNDTASFSGGAA